MSRFFQLLDTIGKTQPEGAVELGEPSPQLSEPRGYSDDLPLHLVTSARPGTKVAEAARSEILKLIHSVFLASRNGSRASSLQGAVVFSGFEQGLVPSQVTAITSELLSEEVPNIRVCAVDANLSNPSLHEHFSISNSMGFSDALQNPELSHRFTQRVTNNLWVMPCGGPLPQTNGCARITTKVAADMAAGLQKNFGYIVMNGGSVTDSTNTLALGQAGFAVILIIEANSTRREIAERYKEAFLAANVAVLGAVLHDCALPKP
jgi:protein-tyrosine kinase